MDKIIYQPLSVKDVVETTVGQHKYSYWFLDAFGVHLILTMAKTELECHCDPNFSKYLVHILALCSCATKLWRYWCSPVAIILFPFISTSYSKVIQKYSWIKCEQSLKISKKYCKNNIVTWWLEVNLAVNLADFGINQPSINGLWTGLSDFRWGLIVICFEKIVNENYFDSVLFYVWWQNRTSIATITGTVAYCKRQSEWFL